MASTQGLSRGLTAASLVAFLALPAPGMAQSAGVQAGVLQAYQELLNTSQKEKRGLMFFVKGQQIGGAVVRVIGSDAVEVRNQTYGRIIIRLDQIDAMAIN